MDSKLESFAPVGSWLRYGAPNVNLAQGKFFNRLVDMEYMTATLDLTPPPHVLYFLGVDDQAQKTPRQAL